jgi:hypothetical protein
MKKRQTPGCGPVLFVACFFMVSSVLSAFGKKEAAKPEALNNEWLLCVTHFDSSTLPENRQAVGDVITRTLVDTLKDLRYRLRISPEYAYYEGYAWSRARSTAAKALAAKQEERARLLYRGDANWKYRRELKKADADIVKLREELALKEAEMPLVNMEPAFDIIPSNKEGNFPPPPPEGREYRFCGEQRADGFLAGTIREYYNRYYVTLRLYALYTDSVIYEDDILFSYDDLNGAVDEISGRLIAALGGTKPAAVAVHPEPDDTLVLINRSFAGRGTVEARDQPPGKVSIELSAADYQPETVETELVPGQLTSISASLSPVEYGTLTVLAPGISGAAVYHGSMYVGEPPLTIRLPVNQYNYIDVTAPDGRSARVALVSPPSGAAVPYIVSLKPKLPPAGTDRVNKARRAYYWAWGGTWIAGIAAWMVTGMLKNQNEGALDGYTNYGIYNQAFFEETTGLYDYYTAAWAIAGVAVAFEIFQMARYIYIATEDAVPTAKPVPQGNAP